MIISSQSCVILICVSEPITGISDDVTDLIIFLHPLTPSVNTPVNTWIPGAKIS